MRERQSAFVILLGRWIVHVADTIPEVDLTGGELWRSEFEQRRLKAAGFSKTLQSSHRDRLAVDFNIFVRGRWIKTVPSSSSVEHAYIFALGENWERIAREFGLVPDWGGRFGVVQPEIGLLPLGWDFGHFGVK